MDFVTSADGTRIAYDRRGSGPIVILIGGAFSDRLWSGETRLAEALADRFTTVTYDRRGRGDSSDESGRFELDRELEDVAALAAALGGPVALYGMSSGAAVALHAVASGLPVSAIALYEPPFTAVGGPKDPPADHRERLVAFVDAGRPADAARYFITRIMGAPAAFLLLMRLTAGWRRAVALAPSLPYDATAMGDYRVPERFAVVTAPTLVLTGAKSPATLRAAAHAVAKAVPGARVQELEGQNHNVVAPVVAPVLSAFFAEAGLLASGAQAQEPAQRD